MSDEQRLKENTCLGERTEASGIPEDASGCEQFAMEPADDADLSLSDADERMDVLLSRIQDGKITTPERAELVGLILAAEQTGIHFPFHVLGIRDPAEMASFIAMRNQAAREMGLGTVYEHMLNDLILGTRYLWEKSVLDEARLISYCDEHLGLRSPSAPRDLVRAVAHLKKSMENFSRIRDHLGRDFCHLIRVLLGMRRSQVLLQIKQVQNLNLAEKQINFGGSGTVMADPGSGLQE